MALSTQELLLKLMAEKSGAPADVLHSMEYKAKKEVLLSLTRGICLCPKIRDSVNKSVQDQKDVKYMEKRRAALQKELEIFANIEKSAKPGEFVLSPEKRKEMNAKQREIGKLSSELKKLKVHQTQLIGLDAEEREYWLFGGEKERLYVRTIEESKDHWGTYSTKSQIDALMEALVDKGIAEKKLKTKLQQALANMRFAEPIPINKEDQYCFETTLL